jgi:hypothetical protein
MVRLASGWAAQSDQKPGTTIATGSCDREPSHHSTRCFFRVGRMDRTARYRQFATQCEQAASLVSRYDHKTVLLDMAQEWRRLADRAEAEGLGRADDKPG